MIVLQSAVKTTFGVLYNVLMVNKMQLSLCCFSCR